MSQQSLTEQLAVLAMSEGDLLQAQIHADQLGLDLLEAVGSAAKITEVPFVLLVSDQGVAIQQTGPKAPGPVQVDFGSGAVAHRRKFGGGAGQQIAKAIGVKPGIRPRIADVTAGLGRDSFVLAGLGCDVTLIERSPIVACLLEDGLRRGLKDSQINDIIARMHFHPGQGADYLKGCQGSEMRPEVVYLDPMFPHSNKSAEVKKEMRLFRQFIGDDTDTAELLEAALAAAINRVVVKRPRKAPCIEGPAPTFKLEGKSGRFDIYALKRLE
ncbi:MAG: class I SAM-dependent methyltransferase [Motiliproteus sp.]|nr:class I SAM-dependent methyltransferase [Motiliproteus sp.]MCW9052584.1 class I SAM-dependent methyltransferase [Motiliproteus sp.]